MQIYVACLASYNNGAQHGDWIDLEGLDANGLREKISSILRESPHPNVRVPCPDCGPHYNEAAAFNAACATCNSAGSVPSAEEWAVHDCDDLPASWGEYPDLDKLCEFVETLEELDDAEREAFLAYRDHEHDGVTVDDFRDAYAGQFDSWADFAEHLIEEQGVLADVPVELARYFDYESYGRDLMLGGDAYEASGFYFWNR
ncbi:antirestriction protein ArdA [Stenotrophomonas sp. RG-453]|uniref:antirestriction protein ArdA n=1 Tax=Stenotrophomonas sp. RG-453 TaxID=2957502 RepID=UPI0029C9BEDF|nr:antirestriction protein ArdA [Stenotrophomonas sp. RG-453]MDX5515120.1 antirestriction protein ArdA [Stenotrophomonas sp. RG-453]